MQEDSRFLLNEQSIKFKALYNETTISNSGEVICTLKGISLIPVSASVAPLTIKENFIHKIDENKTDLETKLFQGQYYLNVVDYTLGEIAFAANFHCTEWLAKIWKFLIDDPRTDEITITLTDETIKNYILEANSDYFKSLEQIDEFCIRYSISIKDLVQSAKFTQLEIQLATISARLSSEIFFFRTKLFSELLIQNISKAIYDYEEDGIRKINSENKIVYEKWKDSQHEKMNLAQKYTYSPYVFDDSEQYQNFESLRTYSPSYNLPQDLLSETFYWIDRFPKVKDRFKRATELFEKGEDRRDCLDNLRLSLELLIKNILKNNKSLENQLGGIGAYQERLGIGIEIRNTFVKTIEYFNKYQNENVKHNIDIRSDHEVEFIFGLTMIFIRMLIKPNKEYHKNII